MYGAGLVERARVDDLSCREDADVDAAATSKETLLLLLPLLLLLRMNKVPSPNRNWGAERRLDVLATECAGEDGGKNEFEDPGRPRRSPEVEVDGLNDNDAVPPVEGRPYPEDFTGRYFFRLLFCCCCCEGG